MRDVTLHLTSRRQTFTKCLYDNMCSIHFIFRLIFTNTPYIAMMFIGLCLESALIYVHSYRTVKHFGRANVENYK